jgi:enamine deaminase RidA (YjgF/YER057c/UK114 family)
MINIHEADFRGTRHVMIHGGLQADNRQAAAAIAEAIASLSAQPVFARFFVSDAANQSELLPELGCPTAVVQQPPLDGSKISVLLFFEDEPLSSDVTHCFSSQMAPEGTSHDATVEILSRYAEEFSLDTECQRTWFYVNDIDNNYAGMVRGRNEVFARHGLTAQTHFIASTGIAGRSANHVAPVTFHAYAIRGLRPGQVRYIHGASHLNPTAEYGVAFERATAIDFADRRLTLVSGTASIDCHGQILHLGDIQGQTRRMVENVEVLLAEAGAKLEEMLHAVVYLRDGADYPAVAALLRELLPASVPTIIVQAPVCRPGWLIEMECMAFTPISRNEFPRY